jgi:hypothetical protein
MHLHKDKKGQGVIKSGKNNIKDLYSDLSLLALVGSNLLVIIWALIEHWSLGEIMSIYCGQSVSIGILWFLKILTLKEFSTEGYKVNDKQVEPTKGTKIQTAVFFLAHYGFFHLGYFMFLRGLFKSVELSAVLPWVSLFFVYQCFSFFYNRKWERKQKPNIGKLMLFPYIRIFPMHLTIIAGGFLQDKLGITFFSGVILVFFMLLKTFADVIMHTIERRGFADRPIKST